MVENKSRSFEASLDRLTAIVKELEGEGVDLERSVELFREGRTLVTHCETLLKTAEQTLRSADGTAAAPATLERPPEDEQPF
jgi:exodeoxyribonuclease VII small subunit